MGNVEMFWLRTHSLTVKFFRFQTKIFRLKTKRQSITRWTRSSRQVNCCAARPDHSLATRLLHLWSVPPGKLTRRVYFHGEIKTKDPTFITTVRETFHSNPKNRNCLRNQWLERYLNQKNNGAASLFVQEFLLILKLSGWTLVLGWVKTPSSLPRSDCAMKIHQS